MNGHGATKRGWIILIAVAGAVILLAAGGLFWKKDRPADSAYQDVTVTRGDLDLTILSTGTVQPENRLDIKAPIAGRAEEVLTDEGRRVKKGDILAWMSSTERAALLDAARARGPEELKRWEEYYRAAPILAPISGTIISRLVEPGQTFTSQDALFVMSDRLTVKAQVDETDIAQIHLKQRAHIVLDAYPGNTISAHVDQIAYDATVVNNVTTYVVDVLPDQTPDFMRSGMTANVNFFVASKKGVLLLPANAVTVRDGRSTVLVPPADVRDKPVERTITPGISDGKRVEVVSGLVEGERVLIRKPWNASEGEKGTPSNPLDSYGRKRTR